jgi:hypothetical protein
MTRQPRSALTAGAWRDVALVLLAILHPPLAGCGVVEERGRKPGSGWSRGVPIGYPGDGALGLAVEPQGERVDVTWTHQTDGAVCVRLVQLDRRGAVIANRDLDLMAWKIAVPQLLPAGEGRRHLSWAERPGSGAQRGLGEF